MFVTSLRRLERNPKNRIQGVIAVLSGPKVDDARNELFHTWLNETKAPLFLMVDTDMVLPENTTELLVKADKDIVGGLCFSMGNNGVVRPVVHRIVPDEDGSPIMDLWYDYPPDSLVQVDGTGGACMLIKRHVAEAVLAARGPDHPMPWFAFSMFKDVRIGEDVHFCLTAGKLGYEVWIDTRLKVPHLKTVAIGEVDYVRSLMDERHPHYNQRETVPIYRNLVHGDAHLDGDQPSPETIPSPG